MYNQLKSCTGAGAVEPAAVPDGLAASANFSARLAAGHGWYVALVLRPGTDYYWYRQDKAGCWSHKPGSTAARNVDNAGQPIADPKTESWTVHGLLHVHDNKSGFAHQMMAERPSWVLTNAAAGR
jgi:hypothetical protein